MAFPAFLDTCVLYGANLNDTLLRIAEEDAFSPQWSPDVVEEFRRNLSMIPNLPAGAADRRVKAMTDAFPEAMVEGYEPLIPPSMGLLPMPISGTAFNGLLRFHTNTWGASLR